MLKGKAVIKLTALLFACDVEIDTSFCPLWTPPLQIQSIGSSWSDSCLALVDCRVRLSAPSFHPADGPNSA